MAVPTERSSRLFGTAVHMASTGINRLVFSPDNGNCSECGQFGFKINCNEMKLLIDW